MIAATSLTTIDWYVMRASGFVAEALLTLVLLLGIATFRRASLPGAPGFVTAALHRTVSLLSVVFLAVHVVTAVADPYAHVPLLSTVLPFGAKANAFWVAVGAVSLDLIAALVVSSLLRHRLSPRAWRAIHWTAYACWPLALAHGLGMGSDVGAVWAQATTLACITAVGLAVAWRLLGAGAGKHLAPPRRIREAGAR
jgi:methionine sulfoxide reductase heme-binding subunit